MKKETERWKNSVVLMTPAMLTVYSGLTIDKTTIYKNHISPNPTTSQLT